MPNVQIPIEIFFGFLSAFFFEFIPILVILAVIIDIILNAVFIRGELRYARLVFKENPKIEYISIPRRHRFIIGELSPEVWYREKISKLFRHYTIRGESLIFIMGVALAMASIAVWLFGADEGIEVLPRKKKRLRDIYIEPFEFTLGTIQQTNKRREQLLADIKHEKEKKDNYAFCIEYAGSVSSMKFNSRMTFDEFKATTQKIGIKPKTSNKQKGLLWIRR